jgi:hypothetical protein
MEVGAEVAAAVEVEVAVAVAAALRVRTVVPRLLKRRSRKRS